MDLLLSHICMPLNYIIAAALILIQNILQSYVIKIIIYNLAKPCPQRQSFTELRTHTLIHIIFKARNQHKTAFGKAQNLAHSTLRRLFCEHIPALLPTICMQNA